ncbi:peptide-methionine (S)-S-oxide reductase MsrA [Frateuria aurantia]
MPESGTELAVFGGGCFWCVEAVYQQLAGVLYVEPGYAGGHMDAPDYETVCAGASGHIEVASIRFDPYQLNYEQLLDVFFATHNPTSLDRQGADVGPQYRSAIFCQNARQEAQARDKIAQLEAAGVFTDPIVTELRPGSKVWPAETYHRDYYARHPQQGYCRQVIAPKLSKLQAKFGGLLRTPAL